MTFTGDIPAGTRVHDVLLRDGRTLRLRAPLRQDADAVLRFYRSLGDRSRYLRFHGFSAIDSRLLEAVLAPDWKDLGALIGVLRRGGEDRVVAVATYARLRDSRAAEVAFAVADDLQGQGAGTRLMEQLAEAAGREGIETFVADVLAENAAMLQVFTDSGFEIDRRRNGGSVEVRFPIAAGERYLDAVDRRDHGAVESSLTPFFEPRSVAVVGASARDGSVGGAVFRNILEGGFTGRAYAVNRSGEPVAGAAAVTDVGQLPEPVDLAVICVPAPAVPAVAEQLLRSGTRALCVVTAGFAETGPAGAGAEADLLALVRSYGARLIGPNCLGLTSSGVALNATFAPGSGVPAGPVAVSSQSGAVGLALVDELADRGIGVSAFVSVGNKADVSTNDLLEHWEDDEATGAIALYLESFGNPRRFARIARRVSRRKPIVGLKSGGSPIGSRAALSHTAALAGSDAAVEGLFRQSGVLRARSLEELLDLTEALATQPLPRGRKIGIVTNAGGLGILCGDACADAGLDLADLSAHTRQDLESVLPVEATVINPVDMVGSATEETFAAVVPAVLADPGVDAVLVLMTGTAVATPASVAESVARALPPGPDKPVLMVATGAHTDARVGGIPIYRYPEAAARVLGRMADRAGWLRRPAGRTRRFPADRAAVREIVRESLSADGEAVWLDPATLEHVLSVYGISSAAQRIAGDRDAATSAAADLGYPVAVKTAASGAHKTEQGGVVLDVRTQRMLDAALAQVGFPALLQRMVPGGAEVMAGALQDPVFGPVVAFGIGGTMAELLGEVRFAPAPLTDVDADELISAGKTGRLLAGVRGAAPADGAALHDLVSRLAQLVAEVPEIREVDLNPVIALSHGCVVVDARIRVRDAGAPAPAKTW